MITSPLVIICILSVIENVYFVAFFAAIAYLCEIFHKFAKLLLKV